MRPLAKSDQESIDLWEVNKTAHKLVAHESLCQPSSSSTPAFPPPPPPFLSLSSILFPWGTKILGLEDLHGFVALSCIALGTDKGVSFAKSVRTPAKSD